MSRWIALIGTTVCAAAGCAATPTIVATAPPAARYAPPADRYVRSVLLDFESPSDVAFVDSVDAKPTADPTTPGNRTLRVDDATIRLGALLRGRTFPGAWDLIGVRVFATDATKITLSLIEGGTSRAQVETSVTAGAWQTVWIETAALAATRPASAPSADDLKLTIHAAGSVLIDDVALAQGRTVVADSIEPASQARFRVERIGLSWRASLGDAPLCTAPASPFVADGFRVVEANAARVVFVGANDATLCVDRMGRVIRAGDAAVPATVGAIDGSARLVRNAPGDRDNDGYDESRGCFTIRATGDRFTVRLDPIAGSTSDRVAIDIDGLRADGQASVYVQGELIGGTTRTTCADGSMRTIVELPMHIARPVEVSVRVR